MIVRFDENRLDEFFQLHNVIEAVQLLIKEEFNAPGRRVKSGAKNTPGIEACPKMRWGSQFESSRVEYRGLQSYIFDEDVFGYFDQPNLRLDLRYMSKSGRPVRHQHRFDYLVLSWSKGILFDEWKHEDDLEKLIRKFPGRYEFSDDQKLHSPPAQIDANRYNATYRIRSSGEISSTRLRNYLYLKDYGFESPENVAATKKKAEAIFANHACIEASDFLETIAVDELNLMLANSLIAFDIDHVFAGHHDRIVLYRNEKIMGAMSSEQRPRNTSYLSHSAKSLEQIQAGDILIYEGRSLTVNLATNTSFVLCADDGNQFSLSHAFVLDQNLKGKLLLPRAERIDPAKILLLSASEKEITEAINCMQIFESYLETGIIPNDFKKSRRTFFRNLAQFKNFRGISAYPFTAFLLKHYLKGFSGTHLLPDVDSAVTEHIWENLLGPRAPSVWSEHKNYLRQCKEERFKVSYKAYLGRYNSITKSERAAAREGSRAEYQLLPFFEFLEDDVPIHGDHALNIVHIDHQNLQLEMVSSITGEPIQKLWLTIAICAYTRRILAFYLSFDSPGYKSVMMILIEIVRRYGRLPTIVVVDGGTDFASEPFETTVLGYGTTIRRRISKPRGGSVQERIFGTTEKSFINNILGNTKIRRKIRIANQAVDPSIFAGVTLFALHEALAEYFFDIYDNRSHPTTLISPHDGYERSIQNHGARLCKSIPFEDDFLITVLPAVKGRTRIVDPQRGVKVNGPYYHHPQFNYLPSKRRASLVKQHPFDPQVVFVHLENKWYRCTTSRYIGYPFYSEWDGRSIFQECEHAASSGRISQLNADIRLAELIGKVNKDAKTRRKDARALDGTLHNENIVSDTVLSRDQENSGHFQEMEPEIHYDSLNINNESVGRSLDDLEL